MRYRIMLTLFFCVLIPVTAQNALYKPFTSFSVIQTEHFDIIFPKESEPTARLLASYADRVYNQVSSLLGIDVRGRIPVTFAPHTDMFNGYYSMSFNHIVIYDTPMDIEWTTFANNLEGIFIHELAHAISLNTRSPFYQAAHRIFGNWVIPSLFNSNYYMIEGVTISFESLDGSGRANDPLAKQYLRQAIFEEKFLTPFQASGVYDRPIQPSGYWYEYGGLFSTWLIKNYGMEKYAELWQAMGKNAMFSFSVYRSGFYRIFSRVYELNFLDAWNFFIDSLTLDNLEINNDELLSVKYRYFSEKEQFINSLTARGNSLYYIDRTERKIGVYDTQTNKIKSINIDSRVYDIDVSADGTTILLSGYNYIEQRAVSVVSEHYAGSGQKTGKTINGLYRARYFKDGVVGIQPELHNNSIVYRDFNGNIDVLVIGNEGLMFSGPQVIDNEWITFIASHNGKRELWFYNYTSRRVFKLESGNDNVYWENIRNLRVSEGKLFFSHNANDRMYKAGLIDFESMQAVFNARDFSGGVFSPVSVNGNIYYLGSFVTRDSILRFPEPVNSFTGSRINLRLVEIEIINYGVITEPYTGPSKSYFSLRYMNPLKLWLPIPLIRQSDSDDISSIRLDGVGVFTLMADPTDRNLVTIIAYADILNKMALIEEISWRNTAMGFPITASFSDTVIETGYYSYRQTRASLRGSLQWTSWQKSQNISLSTQYVRNAGFQEEKNVYTWDETRSAFALTSGYSIAYRRMNLSLSGISFLDSFQPRVDGVFRINTDTRFPLRFTLYGAYDSEGIYINGSSYNYGNPLITNYAMWEYSNPVGPNLNWIGGGEAALDLFSFEIQKNISHLYFNRFAGTLSLRNQIYNSKDLFYAEGTEHGDFYLIQSLMLRLSMTMSFFPVIRTPFFFEPYICGTWKFSNTITGHGSLWHLTIGFNTWY